jgi:hypothetical protein
MGREDRKEGNVSWQAESSGEKRNERKGAGWLIGANGVISRRGRGGTLRKESKSEALRYSATSARKIRAELHEV